MKLMTFRSSCAFAGVCNLLECNGIDLEVDDLVLKMKLPYLFAFEDGEFKAGAMLQRAFWFNKALLPMGVQLKETKLSSQKAVEFLKQQESAMLGLRMKNGTKHAVNYLGSRQTNYCFFNNHHDNEETDEILVMSETELLNRLDEKTVIAVIEKVDSQKVDFRPLLNSSISVLNQNMKEICDLMQRPVQISDLRQYLNPLFRALFLDSIEMMRLIHENQLVEEMEQIQSILMEELRKENGVVCFDQRISLAQMQWIHHKLEQLILDEIRNTP